MQTFLKGLQYWNQRNPPNGMPTAVIWTLPSLAWEIVLDELDPASLLQFACVARDSLQLAYSTFSSRKWFQIRSHPAWANVALNILRSSPTSAKNILGLSLTLHGLRIFRNLITEELGVSWISLQDFSVRASDFITLSRVPKLSALELVRMKGTIASKEREDIHPDLKR